MITSYISRSFQNSSNINSAISTVTNTGLIAISDVCTAGSTNTVSLAYDASTVTALYVQCSNDGTTFNPGSGTSVTLNFVDATIPYTWQTNDNSPSNSWNDDFTTVVVTNGSMTDDDAFVIWVSYTI